MTIPLHIEKLGTKKDRPLILLHGWGQDSSYLRYLGELLAQHHEVHLIDLPGFGLSGKPDQVWNSFDYANRIIDYLDENQIHEADFIGHSFGGKISLSIAISHPKRIKNLVVLAASGLKIKRNLRQNLKSYFIKIMGKTIKKIDNALGTHLFPNYFIERYGSADYKNAGSMRSILVRSVNEDLSSLLPKISASTLILWGDQDNQTPIEMAGRMHRLIPNSTLINLPQHGHELCKDTGAHLCSYHILPFLSRT